MQVGIPFRAVVADSFYGEDRGFKQGLRTLKVGYVLALKPSHDWWHPQEEIGNWSAVPSASAGIIRLTFYPPTRPWLHASRRRLF
jgi:hypothetical protein